ncbi:MAG: hypothetical protein ACR2HV_00995 [Acidimicrobiales bacterium]
MHPKVSFFYYLAAIICFLVAAIGADWRFGARGRKGLAPRLVLVPLGLLLFVIPAMWTSYKLGF